MATINATNTSNPVTVAQGGTGDSSFTAYTVIAAGTTSTGALQNVVGVGTAGQYLQSAGASALPAWATVAPAGALVLLQSQSPSNVASVTFNTGISSTYNNYLFVFSTIIPATSTANLNMLVTTGSGTITTGYTVGANTNPYNSTTITNINSTTFAPLSGALATTALFGYNATLYCYDITSGGNAAFAGSCSFDSSSTGVGSFGIIGGGVVATHVTGFIFSMSSGNITSGTITLFGILE